VRGETDFKVPPGTGPDDPPGLGPYLVMKKPAYSPSSSEGRLYPNRFFDSWTPDRPGWFGQTQLDAMVWPHVSWINASGPNPESRCAVSTIWNTGNQGSYGVFMRALCFAIAEVGPHQWKEICREDLGYVCIGNLTPGDYVEVVYPFEAVRKGLARVNQTLADMVKKGRSFQKLYFFHKSFAFDPVTDPVDLAFPIELERATPLGGVIGGRHGAGWVWWWGDYNHPAIYFH